MRNLRFHIYHTQSRAGDRRRAMPIQGDQLVPCMPRKADKPKSARASGSEAGREAVEAGAEMSYGVASATVRILAGYGQREHKKRPSPAALPPQPPPAARPSPSPGYTAPATSPHSAAPHPPDPPKTPSKPPPPPPDCQKDDATRPGKARRRLLSPRNAPKRWTCATPSS